MLTAKLASKLNLQKKIQHGKEEKASIIRARKSALLFIEQLIKDSMYNEENLISVNLKMNGRYGLLSDACDFICLYKNDEASRDYINKTLRKRGFVVVFTKSIPTWNEQRWLFFKKKCTGSEEYNLNISW